MDDSLATITGAIREFAEERDWVRFHDPKSLTLALMGEVGELAELLQWVPAADASEDFSHGWRQQRIGEELSDILTYLLRLADVLQIDLGTAAMVKLQQSRERFPVAEVRGEAPVKR